MRKYLWIIPVLFLIASIGSTTARADTIVYSGKDVAGIDGIIIGTTTYDVTFGTTEDTTLSTSPSYAADMAGDIGPDLANALGKCQCVADSSSTTIGAVGVDGGAFTYVAGYNPSFPDGWGSGPVSTSTYVGEVASNPTAYSWAEISVVSTPEPSSFTLLFAGLFGLVFFGARRLSRQEE